MLGDAFEIRVGGEEIVTSSDCLGSNEAIGPRRTETFRKAPVLQARRIHVIGLAREKDRERREELVLQLGKLPLRTHSAQYFLKNDTRQTERGLPRHESLHDRLVPPLFRTGACTPEDERERRRVEQDHRRLRSRL